MTEAHWTARSIKDVFYENQPALKHPTIKPDMRDLEIAKAHPQMSRKAMDQVKKRTEDAMLKNNHPELTYKPKMGGRDYPQKEVEKLDKQVLHHRTKQLDLHHAYQETNKHKAQGQSR